MFTSSDEDSKEDVVEGRRALPSDPWLVPIQDSMDHDLVWGLYIDFSAIGKPLPWEGIAKIECEPNDFHSEWMSSPP